MIPGNLYKEGDYMAKKLQPHEKSFLKGIVLTVCILLLPLIYHQPKYDHMKTDKITVSQTYYKSGRRRLGPYIWTPDGTQYLVRGRLPSKVLFNESLVPGTQAEIKYYRGLYICVPMNIISELSVNGEVIIPYHNQQIITLTVCFIAGGIVFLLEFSLFASSAHLLKKLRKQWKKRKKDSK